MEGLKCSMPELMRSFYSTDSSRSSQWMQPSDLYSPATYLWHGHSSRRFPLPGHLSSWKNQGVRRAPYFERWTSSCCPLFAWVALWWHSAEHRMWPVSGPYALLKLAGCWAKQDDGKCQIFWSLEARWIYHQIHLRFAKCHSVEVFLRPYSYFHPTW